MLYAILCYHEEDVVTSWSQQEDQAVMARLADVRARLTAEGSMGLSLRLLPTTAATTVRITQDPPLVIDGPFAETKEQLLGLYVIDVANLEAGLAIARDLGLANPGAVYEIRPIGVFNPDARAGAA